MENLTAPNPSDVFPGYELYNDVIKYSDDPIEY